MLGVIGKFQDVAEVTSGKNGKTYYIYNVVKPMINSYGEEEKVPYLRFISSEKLSIIENFNKALFFISLVAKPNGKYVNYTYGGSCFFVDDNLESCCFRKVNIEKQKENYDRRRFERSEEGLKRFMEENSGEPTELDKLLFPSNGNVCLPF